jgi:hypothetical protein
MVLIKLINIDVIITQAKANINTIEMWRLTYEYIINQPSPKSHLNAIIVALDFASTRTKALDAIIIEA